MQYNDVLYRLNENHASILILFQQSSHDVCRSSQMFVEVQVEMLLKCFQTEIVIGAAVKSVVVQYIQHTKC